MSTRTQFSIARILRDMGAAMPAPWNSAGIAVSPFRQSCFEGSQVAAKESSLKWVPNQAELPNFEAHRWAHSAGSQMEAAGKAQTLHSPHLYI